MPRKRPVEVRMAELERRLSDVKLEKSIADLRARKRATRPIRRRR